MKDLKHKSHNKSSYKPMPLEEVKEEKPFVVVIASFNNEAYVEGNLKSVFEQNYHNYRVIYIDDCSTDKTGEKALECIEKYNMQERVTLIQNVKNQKTLYNLYYAIHSALNEEIVVILDGDDRLSHPRVLEKLNQYYNDDNVWMTYGQYVIYPSYEKGMCRETFFKALKRGKIRKPGLISHDTEWVFSHLRTFYAGLFKRIQLKDLLYNGNFFATSADVATMFPMLEMAREHVAFIPEVLYIYNRETPLNDDKMRMHDQVSLNQHIRNLTPYSKLEELPKAPIVCKKKSALFLFSEDRPIQLYSFLESLEGASSGFDHVKVFYKASDPSFEQGYKLVQEKFKNCDYFLKSPSKKELLQMMQEVEADYVSLTDDRRVFKDRVSIKEAVELLEKTGANGFYFQLGLHINYLPKALLPLGEGSFIWELAKAEKEWKSASTLDMVLYRKPELLAFLKKEPFQSINELSRRYREDQEVKEKIGLCYKESKVAVTPMQMIKIDTKDEVALYTLEELNARFLEGYKLDISPLFQMQNKSTKVEYYPRFIERR